jgi:hypothetical protein
MKERMLTMDELREQLDWPFVDEETNAQYGVVYLFVRPTRGDLEPIYFCLNEERTFIQQFGFGEWHYHPEDISEAVEVAREFVRGEQCIVEERDALGRYLSSGPCPPSGVPDRLSRGTASLRRVFFDREPVTEPVDLGRQHER